MQREWYSKLGALIRPELVDKSDGAKAVVPTTQAGIESYHSKLKEGQLSRK